MLGLAGARQPESLFRAFVCFHLGHDYNASTPLLTAIDP